MHTHTWLESDPAIHVRLFVTAARALGRSDSWLAAQEFETGGEDVPDAFRIIPVEHDHLRYNVVMAREPGTARVKYAQVYAALFGKVYSFAKARPAWRSLRRSRIRR